MRRKTLKQQRTDAELEAIIEDFGRAMRNANKQYIADWQRPCAHGNNYCFTMAMAIIWWNYVDWCKRNPNG